MAVAFADLNVTGLLTENHPSWYGKKGTVDSKSEIIQSWKLATSMGWFLACSSDHF